MDFKAMASSPDEWNGHVMSRHVMSSLVGDFTFFAVFNFQSPTVG